MSAPAHHTTANSLVLLVVVGLVVGATSSTCTPFDSAGPSADAGRADLDANIAATSDASVDANNDDDDAHPSSSCPSSNGGPVMARVGNVCIDSTVVTNGQYRQFLSAPDKPLFDGSTCANQASPTNIDQPNPCAYIVSGLLPPGNANPSMPVVCVTLCDARAFCKWSKKHICAGIDGLSQANVVDIGPTRDEWTHACTEGGAHPFSTGATWQPTGCNVKESGNTAPVATDRTPRCEGPPGVFDLIGNVLTWVDACSVGAGAVCREAGESYSFRPALNADGNPNTAGRCAGIDSDPPDRRAADVGIRCCAAPTL